MNRQEQITHFIQASNLTDAHVSLLAGDASFRKYWRIKEGNKTYVLMDAPPEKEDITPFIDVTTLLQSAQLRVPNIIHADAALGFLLLEDLGDTLFSNMLKAAPEQESLLYTEACNALIALQSYSNQQHKIAKELPPYDTQTYLREVNLFAEWFLVQLHGEEEAKNLKQIWQSLWLGVLEKADLQQNTIVHRDYHADNLLWLQDQGIQRVGMLDYQDALWGDALYDVISLLEDARRDVSEATVTACKNQIFNALSENSEQLQTRYNVLAAQRNCKIIGIFTRLAARDSKPHYLNLLPRVWQHLRRDLTDPVLTPIQEFIETYVPKEFQDSIAINYERTGLESA